MRRLPLLVLVVAALAGCGQSNPDLIPAENAEVLTETADRISQACSDFDRSEAREQVRLAEREIDQLPNAVDTKLKENLQEWVDRIQSRIADDCREEETPTPEPTETATAEPTQTATEEPTETPTEEPTEEPTEAPTEAPTEVPTEAPTEVPTEAPTPAPEGE